MSYTVTSVSEVPDRNALDAMLHVYMDGMLDKLVATGGPRLRSADVLAGLWDDIDAYLPPTGRLVLAHDADGVLAGCGFMRQVRPDAGELKRLYVRPEARGQSLGRRLVLARLDAAREMGWKTLLVDTVKGNTAMLTLYRDLGFRSIGRYPENANRPDYAPHMEFLQLDL